MSTTTLAENEAIIIFGHPNDDNVKVSNDVKDLGLNLLRACPSDMKWICIPDTVQPRYAMFKSLLSEFAFASIHNGGYSKGESFLIPYDHTFDKIPFSPPPIVMSWVVPPPIETLDQIRTSIGTKVQETVSGGKTAFTYTPVNWDDYDACKPFKINIRAAPPVGQLNVKSMSSARILRAVLSAVVHAIRYPAFSDPDHESAFNIGSFRDQDDESEVEPPALQAALNAAIAFEPDAPLSYRNLEKTQNVPLWSIVYNNLPAPCVSVDATSNLDGLPNNHGIWMPFIPQLANTDSKAIPEFLRTFVARSFGDTVEEAIRHAEEVVRDWPQIAKTRFGDEVAHFVTALKVALQGQARPLPIFRRGNYVGTVLLGAGFTVLLNKRWYRPVTNSSLKRAISDSDSHAAAIVAINRCLGVDGDKIAVSGATSMLQLRNVMMKVWTKEKDREELLRMAAYLNFNEDKWAINPQTIAKALSTISDPQFNLSTANAAEFPIHHSMLLSADTLSVVWSCFGASAPSFRVPGGKEFDLGSDMEVRIENPKTGASRVQKLVRIACRMKGLQESIKDLREVLEKRSIMNPVIMPRIRASQQNMDRFFTADQGKEVLAALRAFANVGSSTGKGKRKAEDLGEGSSRKKAFGLDGW